MAFGIDDIAIGIAVDLAVDAAMEVAESVGEALFEETGASLLENESLELGSELLDEYALSEDSQLIDINDISDDISETTDSHEAIHDADFNPEDFESETDEFVELEDSASQIETDQFNDGAKTFENAETQTEEIENSEPEKIKTIRDDLEGQTHPETEVPYVRKVVVTDIGQQVEGVFPQFESKFDAQLPEGLEQASDRVQFEDCNKQLKDYFDRNSEFRNQFDDRQKADIEAGRTPYGYTWHHSEEYGKMQLVDYNVHFDTRHTGGRAIWGGGTENR